MALTWEKERTNYSSDLIVSQSQFLTSVWIGLKILAFWCHFLLRDCLLLIVSASLIPLHDQFGHSHLKQGRPSFSMVSCAYWHELSDGLERCEQISQDLHWYSAISISYHRLALLFVFQMVLYAYGCEQDLMASLDHLLTSARSIYQLC